MVRYLRHVPAERPSAIRVMARTAIAAYLGAKNISIPPKPSRLDHYQVRTWTAWGHRFITLAMLEKWES